MLIFVVLYLALQVFCTSDVIASKTPDDSECDSKYGEVYYECGNCADKGRKCKNREQAYSKKRLACAAVCYEGCFCPKGFLRRKDRYCVKPEDCDDFCDEDKGEVYRQRCNTGDIYCDGMRAKKSSSSWILKNQCKYGCFCPDGFVRNRTNDVCISVKDCPCDPTKREVFKKWGNPCENTCDDPFQCEKCNKRSKAGCYCRIGYVRNSERVCVPPSQCSCEKKCSIGEVYNDCGAPGCQLTCENFRNPPFCPQQCVAGCYCEEGLVRDKDGNCIKREDCPPVCNSSIGEEYTSCGSLCPLTCGNYKNPPICAALCVEGCFCKDDLVRDKDGNCIKREDCP